MARRSTDELIRALNEVVDSFKGRISYAEAVGSLEFVKAEVIVRALDEHEDEEWRSDN